MAKLKRIQQDNYNKEIALVLPVLTRWGTHLECLQSLQKTRIALEQTLMDSRIRETIDSSLRIYMLYDEFWENLNLIASILKPIVATLKLFESDRSTLSSIYSNFKKMMNLIQEISCNFSNEIQVLIEERWNYIYHIIMMVAYMLDPRFLEESRIHDVEPIGYNAFTTYTNQKFGQEKSVELFIEIVKFRNKSSPYDNNIIWESATELTPAIWWESWPNSSLKQLAIKILTIPTSSAAAERNFSTFGFIHNKLRNRLHNNRVKKLVYIYGNLRVHNFSKKLQHNRIETIINHDNETNQEITSNCEEIDNEDEEVENMIYEEGIGEGIEEMIEQIYSSDIDIDNNSLWNQDTRN
ncbi:45160_t:CDS:1, partial [Gigaspora margarita]